MVDLAARRPLAGRGAVRLGGITIRPVPDVRVYLLSTRGMEDHGGAARVGRHDWLYVGTAPAPASGDPARLAQDVTDGTAVIDVGGRGAFDLLGIARLASGAPGAITTRIAGLRITVHHALRDGGEWARLVIERSSADYFWEWLIARARVEQAAAEQSGG